jgi:hypothetical protein
MKRGVWILGVLLVCVLLGVSASPAVIAAPPHQETNPGVSGLVAWWTLNETSGARADSSGGGHTLTDNNTVGYTTGLHGNAAQSVAGNTEDLSSTSNDLNITGDWWMGGAVRFDTSSTTYGVAGNVSSAPTPEHFLLYETSSYRWNVYKSGGVAVANSGTAATLGAWDIVQVWYVSSTQTINIQIDGGSPVSTSLGAAPNANAETFYLLRGYYSNKGMSMDEWFIYTGRVPSTAERAWIYNSGAGRSYADLTAPTATPTSAATATATLTPTATFTLTPTPTNTPTATPDRWALLPVVDAGFESGVPLAWDCADCAMSEMAEIGSYAVHKEAGGVLTQLVAVEHSCSAYRLRWAARDIGTMDDHFVYASIDTCDDSGGQYFPSYGWDHFQLQFPACEAADEVEISFSGMGDSLIDSVALECLTDEGVSLPDLLHVSIDNMSPQAYNGADYASLAVQILFGSLTVGLLILLVFRTRKGR